MFTQFFYLKLEILRNLTFIFGLSYITYLSYLEITPDTITEVTFKSPKTQTTETKLNEESRNNPLDRKQLIWEEVQKFLHRENLPKEEFYTIKETLHHAFQNRELSDRQYAIALEQINQKLYWEQKFASFAELE